MIIVRIFIYDYAKLSILVGVRRYRSVSSGDDRSYLPTCACSGGSTQRTAAARNDTNYTRYECYERQATDHDNHNKSIKNKNKMVNA